MKTKFARNLIAAAVLSATASFAYAGAFDGPSNPQLGSLRFDGFQSGYEYVTGTHNGTAGQFKGNFDPNGSLAPAGGDFWFWCYELGEYTATGPLNYNRYTGLQDGQGDVSDVAENELQLRILFDLAFNPAVPPPNSTSAFEMPPVITSTEGAAIQLAIWEIKYDDNLNLNDGTFSGASNLAVKTIAQDLLNNVASFDYVGDATASSWQVYQFVRDNPSETCNSPCLDGNQDYVSATWRMTSPDQPVPEPGTLALAGLGMLGLGFIRRQKTA